MGVTHIMGAIDRYREKKFYQIRHAVPELSSIEKLLTGVFWQKK